MAMCNNVYILPMTKRTCQQQKVQVYMFYTKAIFPCKVFAKHFAQTHILTLGSFSSKRSQIKGTLMQI